MDPAVYKCNFCSKNNKTSVKIEWLKPQFQKAIAEHFWFEESELLTFQICSGCSKKVMSFHLFYTTVKQIHQGKDHGLEHEENANDEVIVKNEPLDTELISGDITNEDQLIVGDLAFEMVDVSAKNETFEEENELLDEGKYEISEPLINTSKTIACLNCNKSFEDDNVLELHVKLFHGDRIAVRKCTQCAQLEKDLREALEQDIAEEASGHVQYTICDGKLKNMASLQKHLAWHWREPCSMCSKRPKNYESAEDEQEASPYKSKNTSDQTKTKTLVCTYCNKQYIQIKRLETHIETCHKFSPGKCQQCKALDQALQELSGLSESGESGRIKCGVCDAWVINLTSFERHLAWHQSTPCEGCLRKPRQSMVRQQNLLKTGSQPVSLQAKKPKIEQS